MSSMRRYQNLNDDFRCLHCRAYVSSAVFLAGVQNRNHCPYCLWSRHLDLQRAGDRLSACKAPMRPLGLTIKRSRTHRVRRNAYAGGLGGELMLVHRCEDCGALSINRLAADDVAEYLLEVFEASLSLSERLRRQMRANEIHLLVARHSEIIYRQLFGCLAAPER